MRRQIDPEFVDWFDLAHETEQRKLDTVAKTEESMAPFEEDLTPEQRKERGRARFDADLAATQQGAVEEMKAANGASVFEQMAGGAVAVQADEEFQDAGPILIGQKAFQGGQPKMNDNATAVPRLRLAQGLTAEVTQQAAKSGQWVLAGYEPVDEVVFVPGLYNEGRERRLEQTEDANRPVVCKSADNIKGVGDNPVDGACKICPFSQWTPNPRKPGTNSPPKCALQYTYVGWSVTHEALVSVMFQRTAEAQAQQINAFIKARGLGNFAIKLRSSTRTSGRNTFFAPVPVYHKMAREELAEAQQFLLGSG